MDRSQSAIQTQRIMPFQEGITRLLPITLALFWSPRADASASIFTVLMRPQSGFASPDEYFQDLEMFFNDPVAVLATLDKPNSFLAKADFSQDLAAGVSTVTECNLDPFWEKGAIVTDTKYCPLSMVNLILWSLIPALAMFFGLLGVWSRQRNAGGRGKDTQIGSLVCFGLVLLCVAYDIFFCWTLFRAPRGSLQTMLREAGLAHLAACVAVNFLFVHFWLRRKFLVGMPWYEYHKHGFGLHFIFLLMYIQPQAVHLFTCHLFNMDLFNIHFGTPSKMNEVLSNAGTLSMLTDVPQFILQCIIFMTDTDGTQSPAVTRLSMGLTAISITLCMKRQYVASVERRWYKEIVRMAGVRRLTTYGGASRWLRFNKRPSAAADIKANASTSQQQLFLAWMQSMGRRQESIANDASGKMLRDDDYEEDVAISEDSEDALDSLSNSEEDRDAAGPESPRELASGSGGSSEGSHSDGSESSNESNDSGKVELQSYRRRGALYGRDDACDVDSSAFVSSAIGVAGGAGGLLSFARGCVDDMSESRCTSQPGSESDIFAFARGVANQPSESGVLTESTNNFGETPRGRRRRSDDDSSAGSLDVLQYARQVAKQSSDSGVRGRFDNSVADSDIFAFARAAAASVSQSGVGASDIFAFAREVARTAQSDRGTSASGDIMAFARAVAAGQESTVVGSDVGSDIFAAARQAAESVSHSGVGGGTSFVSSNVKGRKKSEVESLKHALCDDESAVSDDIFAAARRAAEGASQSGVRDESDASFDLFAVARAAAVSVSRSGVEGSVVGAGSSVESDVFAAARRAALEASVSGVVTSRSGVGSGAGVSDIFAPIGVRQSSVVSDASSQNLFAAAREAAAEASLSGVSHASHASRPSHFGALSEATSDDKSDIFAFAKHAANDCSLSGVGSVTSQAVASEGDSDIFAAARQAANDCAVSGVESGAGRSVGGRSGLSRIFAPAVRGLTKPAASPLNQMQILPDGAGLQQRRLPPPPLLSKATPSSFAPASAPPAASARESDYASQSGSGREEEEEDDEISGRGVLSFARRVAAKAAGAAETSGTQSDGQVQGLEDLDDMLFLRPRPSLRQPSLASSQTTFVPASALGGVSASSGPTATSPRPTDKRRLEGRRSLAEGGRDYKRKHSRHTGISEQ